VSIYAAVNGYLSGVAVDRIPEFEEKFLTFLDSNAPAVMQSIAKSRELAEQTEAELKVQLETFIKQHPDFTA
jgi:F0F1-type ATP synthase alpha subunit